MFKRYHVDVIAANGLAVILWASAFAGIRVGLTAYSPLHLALLRLIIGSAGLAVFALATHMRWPEKSDLPAILLSGFMGFTVYHAALNIGETEVSAGLSSLIVSLAPVFTSVFAALFLKERLGLIGWIGTAISFGGVALISLGTEGGLQFNDHVLWILLAACSESIYFVIQTPFLKKYGSLTFTAYTIWAGTLFMLFFSPGILHEIVSAPLGTTITAVYLGIFPTVIAYLALAYAISRVGSAQGTSSIYLTPVLAFLIAWVWLGEVPGLSAIIGGVITIAGVWCVNIGSGKERKPKHRSQEISHS
ncbi:DMT family transporter [Sporolactobacillus sp. THM7-7]|nr:DMT family transporter [Sporolactobacillus sp. THM7-7]